MEEKINIIKLKNKLGLCNKEKCFRRSVDTININTNNYKIEKHFCKRHSSRFSNKLLIDNPEILYNEPICFCEPILFFDIVDGISLILRFLFFDDGIAPITWTLLFLILNICYWVI